MKFCNDFSVKLELFSSQFVNILFTERFAMAVSVNSYLLWISIEKEEQEQNYKRNVIILSVNKYQNYL